MGLPTTWFMLNLTHLFWINESSKAVVSVKRYQVQKGVAICGDDLVAFWPEEASARYHELLRECGAKISAGKHYVSSIGRGIFTEKAFTLKKEVLHPFRFQGIAENVFKSSVALTSERFDRGFPSVIVEQTKKQLKQNRENLLW